MDELEFETLVRPVKVHRRCAVSGCGGEMVSAGQGMSIGWSTSWLHRCDVCQAEDSFPKQYPAVEFRAA